MSKTQGKYLDLKHTLLIDEWAEVELEIWRFMSGSVRSPLEVDVLGRSCPSQILGASTPGGAGAEALRCLFGCDGVFSLTKNERVKHQDTRVSIQWHPRLLVGAYLRELLCFGRNMTRRTLLLLLVVGGFHLLPTFGATREAIMLKVTKLLDVRAGKVLSEQAILVEGDKVIEVGPASNVEKTCPGNGSDDRAQRPDSSSWFDRLPRSCAG